MRSLPQAGREHSWASFAVRLANFAVVG